jgi:hypothetical protein
MEQSLAVLSTRVEQLQDAQDAAQHARAQARTPVFPILACQSCSLPSVLQNLRTACSPRALPPPQTLRGLAACLRPVFSAGKACGRC